MSPSSTAWPTGRQSSRCASTECRPRHQRRFRGDEARAARGRQGLAERPAWSTTALFTDADWAWSRYEASRARKPVARTLSMRSNGYHQQLVDGASIHDAEGEAADQDNAGASQRGCASQGMMKRELNGGLHGCLKPHPRACACARVVRDLVKSLRIGRREKPDGCHLAIARARANTSSAGKATTSPPS